jgi:hypothetical protein
MLAPHLMNIGSAQLVTSENLKTSLTYAFYPMVAYCIYLLTTKRGNIDQEGIGQLTGEVSISDLQ